MNAQDDNASRQFDVELRREVTGTDQIAALVSQWTGAGWLSKTDGSRLRLVLEELFSNALMHGAGLNDTTIRLSIQPLPDGMARLIWREYGPPFAPPSADVPAADERPLADQAIGGLGWPLITHYCRLESITHADGQNILRLLFGGSGN